MASAAVQVPTAREAAPSTSTRVPAPTTRRPHDVQTTLNFTKIMPDGSHLAPNYAGQANTYERPVDAVPVIIHDVSGRELDYTLDGYGFQFYYHESKEKEFLDDEQIRREYYPETEQLLKDA